MKRQKTTNKHISAVFAQRVVSAPVSFFVSSAGPNRDNKTPPLPDGPVYPTVTRRRAHPGANPSARAHPG